MCKKASEPRATSGAAAARMAKMEACRRMVIAAEAAPAPARPQAHRTLPRRPAMALPPGQAAPRCKMDDPAPRSLLVFREATVPGPSALRSQRSPPQRHAAGREES